MEKKNKQLIQNFGITALAISPFESSFLAGVSLSTETSYVVCGATHRGSISPIVSYWPISGPVTAIHWPTPYIAFAAHRLGTIDAYNMASGFEIERFAKAIQVSTDRILEIASMPDNPHILATGSEDQRLCLTDLNRNQSIVRLNLSVFDVLYSRRSVTSVKWDDFTGKAIQATTRDGNLFLYDCRKLWKRPDVRYCYDKYDKLDLLTAEPISDFQVVLGYSKGALSLVDLRTQKQINAFCDPFVRGFRRIQLDPETGNRLVISGEGGVSTWNINSSPEANLTFESHFSNDSKVQDLSSNFLAIPYSDDQILYATSKERVGSARLARTRPSKKRVSKLRSPEWLVEPTAPAPFSFYSAVKSGDVEFAKFVAKCGLSGFSVKGGTLTNALEAAALNDDVKMVELLLENSTSMHILELAPRVIQTLNTAQTQGETKSPKKYDKTIKVVQHTLEKYLKIRQKVDRDPQTKSLIRSCQEGKVEEVKDFLSPKDEDVRSILSTRCLLEAVEKGHVDLASMLLDEFKPYVFIQAEKGLTLLRQAIIGGQLPMVQLISENLGTFIKIWGKDFTSPLFYAIDSGHQEIATHLLHRGADFHHGQYVQGQWYTSLRLATEKNFPNLVEMIAERSSKSDIEEALALAKILDMESSLDYQKTLEVLMNASSDLD